MPERPTRSTLRSHGSLAWLVLCAALYSLPASLHAEDPLYSKWITLADPLTPEDSRKTFRVPPGFDIELVASEPDIYKPMNLAFDARGRLWATTSIEYPLGNTEDRPSRDRVMIFEDRDGDGRPEHPIVFAEDLNIPIGLLPTDDGAIVYSIPKIEKFIDADGDGRADERIVLYERFGRQDTHGMVNGLTLGFDGWVYACHGFANISRIANRAGDIVSLHGGASIRFRPDGSRFEVNTIGQVNPFGMAEDAFGDHFSADCHSQPLYLLLRGGWYPNLGKPHEGLGFAPAFFNHRHSSTGIAGVAIYDADHFPKIYKGTVFTGNVVTNRIEHDRLERHGSSYKAHHLDDFLTSEDPWFRPVDLTIAPDGSLYIADFYNRIIGHYEVPLTHPGRDHDHARIWRVIYKAADRPPRARDLTQAVLDELIAELSSTNIVVRKAAQRQIVARFGRAAVPQLRQALADARSPLRRTHALWALHELGVLAISQLEMSAVDDALLVRVHTQRVLGATASLSEKGRQLIVNGLNDRDPLVVRAAAEALGDQARSDSLRPLLRLAERVSADDSHLRHTIRLAIRRHLRRSETWAALAAAPPTDAERDAIRDVIYGIHTAESAAFLLAHFRHPEDTLDNNANSERSISYMARYLSEPKLAALFDRLQLNAASPAPSVSRLRAFRNGIEERGGGWSQLMLESVETLAKDLFEHGTQHADHTVVAHAISLVRDFQLDGFRSRLEPIAHNPRSPLRGEAYTALVRLDSHSYLSELQRVVLSGDEPRGLREHAIRLLGGLRSSDAYRALAACLGKIEFSLAERIVDRMINSRESGELFLAEIVEGRASPLLLMRRVVHPQLARSGVPENYLEELIPKLTAELPTVEEQFTELVKTRKASFASSQPNVTRGAEIFQETCSPCHQIAEKGGKIAPSLDSIGLRGVDRLLEDVLDPSRNIDAAFRASLLVLSDGSTETGLVVGEQGDVLLVANAEGKEVRIPQTRIVEKRALPLSPMPGNFKDVIPPERFNDLLGFLLSQRKLPEPAGGGR